MKIDEAEMILVGIGDAFEEKEDALKCYNMLAGKLDKKNYFVVSMCMDDRIFESDLRQDRIVAPLGGKRKKQCPDACENKLYDVTENECPICHKELTYNNILCENYIEDGYMPMWEKQRLWLTGTMNKKLLLMELGVSMKFPQIIRWPFERLALLNNKAFLLRVNEKLWQLPEEIGKDNKGEAVKESPLKYIELL